jgi:hypothetical protein
LARTGELRIKINIIELTMHRQNPRGNPDSVIFPTVTDEFTFQKDNKLKHKAKSTLELLTKTTNGLEWRI